MKKKGYRSKSTSCGNNTFNIQEKVTENSTLTYVNEQTKNGYCQNDRVIAPKQIRRTGTSQISHTYGRYNAYKQDNKSQT